MPDEIRQFVRWNVESTDLVVHTAVFKINDSKLVMRGKKQQ